MLNGQLKAGSRPRCPDNRARHGRLVHLAPGPAAQPRLVARLGLAARLHARHARRGRHTRRDARAKSRTFGRKMRVKSRTPLVARWYTSRVSKLNLNVKSSRPHYAIQKVKGSGVARNLTPCRDWQVENKLTLYMTKGPPLIVGD